MLLLTLGTSALGLLVLAWLIYPAAMVRRGARAPVSRAAAVDFFPRISVVLVTREEPDRIALRVANLRDQDYPQELLQYVVALDASIAGRLQEMRQALSGDCIVTIGTAPGKSSALNAGVTASDEEMLLFVDTAQTFARDALSRLVHEMQSEEWGALTATLAATSGDTLMDHYWQRELRIRQGQESKHSIICVTGCAYLMRRRFWRDMLDGLICDDLWSTFGTVTNGGRVGIVSAARISDPRRFTREQEYGRRLRTMTGMLQFIRLSPEVLSPRRNPMWSDFLLHKLMRPATPLLLMLAGASYAGALFYSWPQGFWALLALAVGVTALVALTAIVNPKWTAQRLATLRFAQRLMFMPLRAIGRALRSDWDVWKPAKS